MYESFCPYESRCGRSPTYAGCIQLMSVTGCTAGGERRWLGRMARRGSWIRIYFTARYELPRISSVSRRPQTPLTARGPRTQSSAAVRALLQLFRVRRRRQSPRRRIPLSCCSTSICVPEEFDTVSKAPRFPRRMLGRSQCPTKRSCGLQASTRIGTASI